MGKTIHKFLDILFSERCSLCGDLLTFDREWVYPLCRLCVSKLETRTGYLCTVCSTSLVSEHLVCTRCRERDYSFESNYSLFFYDGAMRELIHQFKSRNSKFLASFFSDRMAQVISESYQDFAVVPVPFRASQKRSRGWDQIEAICDILRRAHGVEVIRLLRRKRSAAQKTLDYSGRLANLQGSIAVKPKKAVPRKVLLIDDVFTTGATADACASALREAGAAEVRALTIALDQ
jgi:ComF family protein